MKRVIISVAIFAALLSAAGAFIASGTAAASGKERAIVEFRETVKLGDVFLKGEYLVVHDDQRMAEGGPCLYIYNGTAEKADKLAVSYHCRRVDRKPARDFTIVISRARWFEIPEVTEIQFAGSSEGHQVPF